MFEKGEKLSYELTHPLAKFKKPGDLMVHVSTFCIIDNVVYMTYYANRINAEESPNHHIARFVKCNLNSPENKEYYDIQGAELSGLSIDKTSFDGKTVSQLYDIILISVDNRTIYIMWTAALDGNYTRLYQTYDTKTGEFGPIAYNYFAVNGESSIMDIKGIEALLTTNGIEHKPLTLDIGIMQKISKRWERGEVYYYTGCYANKFNCIIKSKDLITWEYVSSPDFTNLSQFENAVYVKGNKVYYFCRQEQSEQEGFLSFYNLDNNSWYHPVYINDAQSRSDFIEYRGHLYAIHAPYDRNHIAITQLELQRLENSKEEIVAIVPDYFYPYTLEYNDKLYMSFTAGRQDIYLSQFSIDN